MWCQQCHLELSLLPGRLAAVVPWASPHPIAPAACLSPAAGLFPAAAEAGDCWGPLGAHAYSLSHLAGPWELEAARGQGRLLLLSWPLVSWWPPRDTPRDKEMRSWCPGGQTLVNGRWQPAGDSPFPPAWTVSCCCAECLQPLQGHPVRLKSQRCVRLAQQCPVFVRELIHQHLTGSWHHENSPSSALEVHFTQLRAPPGYKQVLLMVVVWSYSQLFWGSWGNVTT
nr:uncharacterized protein LOC105882507 [Microcebus murinus]